ncbi:TIGR02757 family protein [Parabacteroides distasonis]|nr:TIGR02757 family protein [Parabacteroides distasonis]
MSLSQETKDLLIRLADQYETKEFIKDDPIRFPHEVANRGGGRRDIEISAILSSWLAYGNRKQFCRVLQVLHEIMDYKPCYYLCSHSWRIFEDCDKTMYRFFIYHDFYALMDRLETLYSKDAFSFTDRLSKRHPLNYLIACFHDIKGFPKDDTSACKRLNMLLRWMSRKNSPVDLGLWDIDPAKLVVPVDTHVHRMALQLGLTQRKQADMKTAIEITDAMREIWLDDPAKGDFALFGYGVNHK